ncbi:MAG: archaellin/type IV pilin N-terminal domain-containing protein [Candidatus Pacearchaeota archaeon]
MSKMNNKAISEVVTTVLILMLTVAAIGVIAGFVVPFVKNSLQKSSECLGYDNYFSFSESGLNCYKISGQNYLHGVSVSAVNDKKLSENIDGLVLVLKAPNAESKTIAIKSGAASLEVWMLEKTAQGIVHADVIIPAPGETRTYVYNSNRQFNYAEVYPLLKSGRICEKKDTINLIKCSESANLG